MQKTIFPIFFGDKKSCPVDWRTPAFYEYCTQLAKELGIAHLAAHKQVHGTDGTSITNAHELCKQPAGSAWLFEREGDFLVTNQKNIGIGVLTADCLPIIIQDPVHAAIAAIHAGWPGTVANIVQKTLNMMHTEYGTKSSDVHVYFGPSAKACCYEVQADFYAKFEPLDSAQKERITQSLVTRDNKLYFDNPACNKYILMACGVPEKHIHTEHNICTICHDEYHSYRRHKEHALRQLTITWIPSK